MSGDAVLNGGNGAKVYRTFARFPSGLHHGAVTEPSKRGFPGGNEGEAAAMLCTVSIRLPSVEPVGTVLRSADPPQRTSESLRVRRAPTGKPLPVARIPPVAT